MDTGGRFDFCVAPADWHLDGGRKVGSEEGRLVLRTEEGGQRDAWLVGILYSSTGPHFLIV